MGKPRDKFWDHAEAISNEGEGPRWKCKFCNKIFSGGASRIKAHLSKAGGGGIKVCEAVDEATMEAAKEALEGLESNKKNTKRRRLETGMSSPSVNPQVADLQPTLPFLGQSNLDSLLQGSPDAIHGTGLPRQCELMDLDDISTCSGFGESTMCARMQEFRDEILVEGPSNAQINDQSNMPWSIFDAAAVDRSDWHQYGTLPEQVLHLVSDDHCRSMARDLQGENANSPSPEIQSLQPDAPILLPVKARPPLSESTLKVRTSEVNICEDNPVQGEHDPLVEACKANNTMIMQPDRFDPMQIDLDPNNGGIASLLPQLSSGSISAATDFKQDEMLAPKLTGRDFIVDKLWDFLMKDNILRIGVYGMGGVGKTTTMKHLYNKLCASTAFANVLWITVSKDCRIHDLQNKVAKALNVPDLFKDVDEAMRSTLLFNHLRKKMKSLIILDDIWQHFELKEVGIPVMKDGIQLVLTTRDVGICQRMLCQEVIRVKPLSDEESWNLFLETLHSDLSPSRIAIAESIVKECKGLPLAINVLAGSMRGVDSDHGWEDTLEKLKKPEALQEDMRTGVFPILLHSYSRLNVKKQQCFLQCALYPEDWKIYTGELIESYIDEGLIRGDSRWKMYNEGHQVLDELVKACLLEEVAHYSYNYHFYDIYGGRRRVRMHDVVRHMALYIMNGNSPCMVKSGLGLEDVPNEDEWFPSLQKVSLMYNKIEVVPSMSPNCPQLSTLSLRGCSGLCDIPQCFFERIRELKVIDLSHTHITRVLGSVINLDKLNALLLRKCSKLSRIPSLVKLTLLKKLDLRGCKGIEEVPDGLGMLVNLTYLDLSETRIERISNGVISELKKLQYLRVEYIEVKGEEVGKLKKLELLQCRFLNVKELNKYTQAQQATTIKSYILLIGPHANHKYWHNMRQFVHNNDDDNLWDKKVVIMGEGQYNIGEVCHLPRDMKALRIDGFSGSWNTSSFSQLEELEVLHIENCGEVTALSGSGSASRGQPGDHCPNLKVLVIRKWPKLKHMLVLGRSCSSTFYLKKLKWFRIHGCKELESIVAAEEASSSSSSPPPPPLLPPGAFSQVQSIRIIDCPKMKNLIGPELLPHLHFLQWISIDGAINMDEIIVMPSPRRPPAMSPLLPLLTSIYVSGSEKMKRVLSVELFMILPNLQEITVQRCGQMKEVIGQELLLDHGATFGTNNTSSLLSHPIAASPDQLSARKLTLKLYHLEELESICSWAGLRDLIHVIDIKNCPKLKRIEMLDVHDGMIVASPPPSLKEILLSIDGDGEWWDSLEWFHPVAKTALEPYVFITPRYPTHKIPIQEWRSAIILGRKPKMWRRK
ncbi:disease resistance protein RPS2-like [Punica granatum]|uniref:BED-type domain-containing protein n=2 Tax=Punica granatum TaxID=22663 RepID=A0A218W9I9_PUNGR|nr:disease resistance protein RPS2-like [Punica granatum]XP_031389250.1 disease resistance protein RPS2-like [Punica granatum]XP_031389251.1 disease resistance protein RPS2-like [Punica granatum]XP_031389252.1 disease resistance protein RPS2-like [Punica granatum]OWM69527.1 hypothetical protein CDL15_Pgr013988 [Punica granatum]PKI40764.1 hypothetical protein CRG98_038775 [Punica granatum]